MTTCTNLDGVKYLLLFNLSFTLVWYVLRRGELSLLLLRPLYSEQTNSLNSIPWLLIPWLLASQEHQHPSHWLCYVVQSPWKSPFRGPQPAKHTPKSPLYNHVWNPENQAKFILGLVKAQTFSWWLGVAWYDSNATWPWLCGIDFRHAFSSEGFQLPAVYMSSQNWKIIEHTKMFSYFKKKTRMLMVKGFFFSHSFHR